MQLADVCRLLFLTLKHILQLHGGPLDRSDTRTRYGQFPWNLKLSARDYAKFRPNGVVPNSPYHQVAIRRSRWRDTAWLCGENIKYYHITICSRWGSDCMQISNNPLGTRTVGGRQYSLLLTARVSEGVVTSHRIVRAINSRNKCTLYSSLA